MFSELTDKKLIKLNGGVLNSKMTLFSITLVDESIYVYSSSADT